MTIVACLLFVVGFLRSLRVNAGIMDGIGMSFLSQPPVLLPSQFASLSSIVASQTEIEPVDLVCSEDSSSLGGLHSFRQVSKDADIDFANDENTTNFYLGNSGEFLHKVHFAYVVFAFQFVAIIFHLGVSRLSCNFHFCAFRWDRCTAAA